MPESEVCTPQLAISGRLPNRFMQRRRMHGIADRRSDLGEQLLVKYSIVFAILTAQNTVVFIGGRYFDDANRLMKTKVRRPRLGKVGI